MSAWTAADHPRGDGGRFTAKAHAEPEGGLTSEQVSTPKTFPDGWVEWRTPEGKRHRIDGPAITTTDGHEEWWENGELHRVGGPAVISPSGYEAWIIYDQYHRVGGPARTLSDGTLEWWVNGVRKPPEVEAMLTMMWRARTP